MSASDQNKPSLLRLLRAPALRLLANPAPVMSTLQQASSDLTPLRGTIFDLQPALDDVLVDYPRWHASDDDVDDFLANAKTERQPESELLLRTVATHAPKALSGMFDRYRELARTTFPDVGPLDLLERAKEEAHIARGMSPGPIDFTALTQIAPFTAAIFRDHGANSRSYRARLSEGSSHAGGVGRAIGSDGSIPGARHGEANALTPKVTMNGVILPPTVLANKGALTLAEANNHYRNGNGIPITVYAPAMNFGGVKAKDFDSRGRLTYTFPKTSKEFYVYGTVSLQLNPDGKSFRVLNDRYDFDMHSWWDQSIRNLATVAGSAIANPAGKARVDSYDIVFMGDIPIQ